MNRHHYARGMKVTNELVLDADFDTSTQMKDILVKQFEEMLTEAIIRDGTMFMRNYRVSIVYNPLEMIHDIRWESKANG